MKASFTGVGPVGNDAARALMQVIDSANARRKFQGLSHSTFDICLTEKRNYLPAGMIEEQHVAFLLGSTRDPRFWLTRKTILSSSPNFLLTLGTLEINQDAAAKRLAENEAFLLLRSPVDIRKVSQLILHLFSVLAAPNFISVDLSDFVCLFGGAHLAWSVYQTASSSSLQGYERFLQDSVEEISESASILALFCFDDPRFTFLNDLGRVLEPLDRMAGDDSTIVFLPDWTTSLEIGFEVHLARVAKANSPSKPGKLLRDI